MIFLWYTKIIQNPKFRCSPSLLVCFEGYTLSLQRFFSTLTAVCLILKYCNGSRVDRQAGHFHSKHFPRGQSLSSQLFIPPMRHSINIKLRLNKFPRGFSFICFVMSLSSFFSLWFAVIIICRYFFFFTHNLRTIFV